MKPTSDKFEPRRDGWFEHEGTWDEVTVGTVLATKKRTERWEVIATAHGSEPIQYGYTLWFQIREQTSGDTHPVSPRLKTGPVTILTLDPADTQTPPRTEPNDSDAIEILIRELGAEFLARRDHETGEIVCPDYIIDPGHLDGDSRRRRGLLEHLKFAHGITAPSDTSLEDVITLHGRAHRPGGTTGGFPHRHVPEADLSSL